MAEGGFVGNSATPERIQKADSPAVLLVQSRTPHKSFLFLLEEKNRRAQIKKCEENFFAGWRGFRATAGLASLLGVLLNKCSNFIQKTPQRKNVITSRINIKNAPRVCPPERIWTGCTLVWHLHPDMYEFTAHQHQAGALVVSDADRCAFAHLHFSAY